MKITKRYLQEIRLSEAYYNYGLLIKNHGDLPTEGGFAGFKLHAPLNQPDYDDELIVFQGGSNWRALGKIQRYGISSRGIALNTGIEGTPEEFPDLLLGICFLREAPERAIGSDWRRKNGG